MAALGRSDIWPVGARGGLPDLPQRSHLSDSISMIEIVLDALPQHG